jgi:phosphoribosylaminoimidazolecarboxamide formyltransferase/IMP cyclohydrolase
MTQRNTELRAVRRALLSVSDKTGVLDFARALQNFNIELISTGGTAQLLRAAGLAVREVSELTNFPEMMDGRIKTLHPLIHGALLALRDNAAHVETMRAHGIEPIDMVVVNLYPFEQTIARETVTLAEAIEQIDIGGPAMIRSAAKNFRDVTVVVSPQSYDELIAEMKRNAGALSLATRQHLALQAFTRTAAYDQAVSSYLRSKGLYEDERQAIESVAGATAIDYSADNSRPAGLAESIQIDLTKETDLRYGENPHQFAALYATGTQDDNCGGVAHARVLSGKEMSYNNYVDADAAWNLVLDFDEMACAIIKHTNPAGAAIARSTEAAYRCALATDPVSAFGGIVAFNRAIDMATAKAVTEIFTEVIIAPGYEREALEILRARKNLRILEVEDREFDEFEKLVGNYELKQISGGFLLQTRDTRRLKPTDLKTVTRRAPTQEETNALLFAWTVCKHTKSNAIVYAREGQTVGVGAGQMSRVDSVKIGAMRAQLPMENSVLASDAFFPFRDGIDEAARHGITAVIQPGGSVRDEEVIAAADEHNLAMVFTGVRHFKH